MLEAVYGLFAVSRHREVTEASDVIPFEGESQVFRAGPVGGDALVFLVEDGKEVFGVLSSDDFDSEVVDDE